MPEAVKQDSPEHLLVRLEAELVHKIKTVPRGPRMMERVKILEAAYKQTCNVRDLVKLADEIAIPT